MLVGRAVRNRCTPKCPGEPFLGSQQLSPPSCGGLGRVLGLCQAAAGEAPVVLVLLGNREWLPAKAFIRGLTKLPPNFTGTTEYSPACSAAEVIFSYFVYFTKLWRCCLSWRGYQRSAPALVVALCWRQAQDTWLGTALPMLGWAALFVALAEQHRPAWFSSKARSNLPLGHAVPMTVTGKHEVKIKSGVRTAS